MRTTSASPSTTSARRRRPISWSFRRSTSIRSTKPKRNHKDTLGHLLFTAAEIAREKGFAEDGYRVVINTNADGGQTVFHLHVHLLAGRQFIFPPG